MPGKIAAAHHTLADWDFETGATNRSLSSDYFISAPTSLKFISTSGIWYSSVLCRLPATLCLPQGEVRTWVRRDHPAFRLFTFRNQAPLGTANILNCYLCYPTYSQLIFIRSVDGHLTTIGVNDIDMVADTWYHFRIFWYNGKTPGEVPALCIDFYKEVDDEWIKIGPTIYDTLNKWKDSEINRCGLWPEAFPGKPIYFDNTEIWGPV